MAQKRFLDCKTRGRAPTTNLYTARRGASGKCMAHKVFKSCNMKFLLCTDICVILPSLPSGQLSHNPMA